MNNNLDKIFERAKIEFQKDLDSNKEERTQLELLTDQMKILRKILREENYHREKTK